MEGTALANITCLSRTTLMMPIRFVQIKTTCLTAKRCPAAFDAQRWGPGLLVFDSSDPLDLNKPHGRYVADSRDFSKWTVHASIRPNPPVVWEDLQANEVEGDERNVVQRIFQIFKSDCGRPRTLVTAASIFQEMHKGSRLTGDSQRRQGT